MKKIIILVTVAITVLFMWSCSQKHSEIPAMEMSGTAAYDMAAPEGEISESQNYSPETYVSSSTALENLDDTARRMIRTADIKFKVAGNNPQPR